MTRLDFLRALAAGGGGMVVAGGVRAEEDKWAKEVAAVEERLARQWREPGGVVFAGSSSVRLWKLDRHFPEMGALNAGFGGSTLADCERYARRLVYAWRPRVVLLYAGDNDVANGLTPDQVASDFLSYATALHGALPECRLAYLSIKPSPLRWRLWPHAAEANSRIRALCEAVGGSRLVFVDVATPLLGPNGQPDQKYFLDDRLHLNEAGYEKWRAVVDELMGR